MPQRRLALFVIFVLFVVLHCGRAREPVQPPAASVAREALRPVNLPDLPNAASSVREQVREGYARFRQRVDDARTSTADLGAAYGEMGRLFLAAELRDQAEACLLNAEALAPGESRWPYLLGHLYKQKGDGPQSAAAFERALKLQPNDVPTLVWLGVALMDQGKASAAEPLFAKAVSLQPRSVAALIGLGRAALEIQQPERAVQSLEQALAIDPQATIAHYPLAMAYRARGDRAKAEEHLRQRGTQQVKPDDPLMDEVNGLLRSALAYEVSGAEALDHGKWAAAIDSFRKGIALAPSEPSLHHKLGTALALSGDSDGAYRAFQEAVRLSPKFAKAHYSLGVLEEGANRHQQAIQHLRSAVAAQSDYIEARLQLGHALRRSGQLAESLAQYEFIIGNDARVPEARFGYAAALFRLNRLQEARDRLVEAMTLYPNEPAFARALARLLAAAPDDRVRNGNRAAELMQTYGVSQLPNVELLETRAMVAAEAGQFSDAVMWQREAIAAARASGRDDIAQLINDHLALYTARRPCRTPWRPEEPIEFATLSGGPSTTR